MEKMLRCLVLLALFCCYNILAVRGQVQPVTAKMVSAIVDRFNKHTQAEKVFLHTDKPYYNNHDTIWLKAYLLDQQLAASAKSGLLYVELINDTGKVTLRQCLPVQGGISYGQMALNEKQMPEGSYQLRAYTNWMQNQGTESFFYRPVYIRSTAEPWLVSTHRRTAAGLGEQADITLRLTSADGRPVGLHPVQVLLIQNDQILDRQNLQTSTDGELMPQFKLPEKAGRGSLQYILQEIGKNAEKRRLVIPVEADPSADIDLQFLPEGGHLVAGLINRVAFKALGVNGKGTAVQGTVTDDNGKTIIRFQSAHLGMGVFELRPVAGQTYTAHIHFPENRYQNVTLPLAEPLGIVLHAENLENSDSLTAKLQATPGWVSGSSYFLIGQSAGNIIYSARVNFERSSTVTAKIPKAAFPTGLARFTLLSAKLQPVAERLVFVDHGDAPKTTVQINPSLKEAGKPVNLQVSLSDGNRQPLPANLSLSVTDDSMVKADSSNVLNIRSYMLLCGNLTGSIEEPGYYFDSRHADRFSSLDLLLLTQGWAGYSWQQVFQPNFHPVFAAEQALQISGQLSRTGGKAVAGLPVMLLSTRKPLIMMDTVSDQNGRFVFRHLPPYDTASFMVQVKDKKGKMFEATVQVDQFMPAKANLQKQSTITAAPWYVNAQNENLNYLKTSQAYTAYRDSLTYGANAIRLKGVTIRAIKSVRGSQNLNGPGKADQVLDETDLKKAGKMTLMELLYQRIKGFRPYYIYDKKVKFVFDGTDLDFSYQVEVEPNYAEYLQRNIDLFNAEDIRGIEVMYNNDYNGSYTARYNPSFLDTFRRVWPAYIEITTWSGAGPFQRRKSGNYLYSPIPLSWPKQFYQPRYINKEETRLADLRSTIYWAPNLSADAQGKLNVSFPTKSIPGKYTLVVQGSDLNGNLIYHRQTFSVP